MTLARSFDLPHQAQRGRRHEHVAHAVPGHELERPFGIELGPRRADHRHAVEQRGQQHVEQASGPGPVGGRPESITGLRKEVVRDHHAGEMTDDDTAAMQHALRLAGRPRRVHQDRGIVGPRIGVFAAIRGGVEQGGEGVNGCAARFPLRSQRNTSRSACPLSLHRKVGRGRQHHMFQRLDPAHGVLDPLERCGSRQQDAGGAVGEAELQGIRAEQVEQRQRDGPELLHCDMRDHALRALRQVDADDHAPAHAKSCQGIR